MDSARWSPLLDSSLAIPSSLRLGCPPPRPETAADRRARLEEGLRRQGLRVCACPGCGETAAVEECRIQRAGGEVRLQRVLRCHSPRRKCPPRVLEEVDVAAEAWSAPRECPVCRGAFEPRVANQRVCSSRDCRREWKRVYMQGFWERQRRSLEALRAGATGSSDPLPLPRLARELAALAPEEFVAVLRLVRAERRREAEGPSPC